MVKKIKIGIILLVVGICAFLLKKIVSGNVTSINDFKALMSSFGILGPVVLFMLQILLVIVPVLPGYFGIAVGSISYGIIPSFICNYISISIGSILAFYLAGRFGKKLVTELFSEKTYEKWFEKIKNTKSYDALLFLAMLLPGFPDNFLCYFSGLMGMNKQKFTWIIIAGKPWVILGYCLIFGMIK